MVRYTKLYGAFLVQQFKVMMEYRANFFIGMSSTLILQGLGLVAVWAVMRQVPQLGGWSFDEILLVYGLVTMAKSINHMFADNLWTLGRFYIRTGGFDRFLLRPIDPLFHLLADRFCHDGIGNFIVGLVLLVRSSIVAGIVWTPLKLLYLLVAVLSGGLIFIALNLITAVSAFWIMDSVPVTVSVFNTHEFAKYPLSIYRRFVGVIITWIIPYGFASFYPAAYLLGRGMGVMAWLAPVMAAVLLLIGYRTWQFGLKHYGGTGS